MHPAAEYETEKITSANAAEDIDARTAATRCGRVGVATDRAEWKYSTHSEVLSDKFRSENHTIYLYVSYACISCHIAIAINIAIAMPSFVIYVSLFACPLLQVRARFR